VCDVDFPVIKYAAIYFKFGINEFLIK